jgi:hypothetical protein
MTDRRSIRLTLWIAALAALAAPAADAAAQGNPSGLQMTPDSRRYLVSKDVGPERWAISFDLETRTVTGNVFKTDGSPPSFIWCRITSETPAANPADNAYLLDCFGAGACEAAPCASDAWIPIGSGIPIGGDFLLPEGTRATFAGHVQPIFTQRCATGGCHLGPVPAQGLILSADQAYANIFLKVSTQEEEHFLVEPFDPGSSHLYGKILGTEEEGVRMPVGGPYLTDEQSNAIRDWILEGAANN